MEALTVFIQKHVVPTMSSRNEGVLLEPVLNYLAGWGPIPIPLPP